MTGTAESLDPEFRAVLPAALHIQPTVPVLAPTAHAVRDARLGCPRAVPPTTTTAPCPDI